MKQLILIPMFLLVGFIAKADYSYMSLPELILKTENCVSGTIVGTDVNYFYLKVDRVLFGKAENDTLKVMRFEDWSCGRRYDAYKTGQKEIVCFHKSNELIADYELIGYGGGCEFEIEIAGESKVRYQYGYGRFVEYSLSEFISAITEYKKLSLQVQNKQEEQVLEMLATFGGKSDLHKLLGSGFRFSKPEGESGDVETSGKKNRRKGSIRNRETSYLYDNYENKLEVQVENERFEDLILEVEDAEVRKNDGYFTVKPIDGWARRWIYVRKVMQGDTTTLLRDIFNVYPIPEPTVYVNDHKNDTISLRYATRCIPRVKYDLGSWYTADNLEYEVLKFSVDITTGNSSKTVNCKYKWGNFELSDALSQVKDGSTIRYYNIFVLYPDGQIKQVKDKTVYIRKEID